MTEQKHPRELHVGFIGVGVMGRRTGFGPRSFRAAMGGESSAEMIGRKFKLEPRRLSRSAARIRATIHELRLLRLRRQPFPQLEVNPA